MSIQSNITVYQEGQRSTSLDSIAHNCNSTLPEAAPMQPARKPKARRCGQMTLIGPVDDYETAYSRHRCKGYGCGICGPRKMRRAGQRIAELAAHHGLSRMLTLTLDPKSAPAGDDSIPYIRQVWRKFRVYLQRQLHRSIEFIQVLEIQPGTRLAHLHVLVSEFIPWSFVRAAWSALGGGRIVDIRQVDVRSVAAYMSKYLTKTSETEPPPGVRRFTMSRGLRLWLKAEDARGWRLAKVPIENYAAYAPERRHERFDVEPDGREVLAFFTVARDRTEIGHDGE